MITFEKVQPTDIDCMADVKFRAFEPELKRYGISPAEMCSVEWNAWAMEHGDYYKILRDGQIAGGLHLFVFGQDFYNVHELNSIFVLPECQNQGIGSRAIRFIEETYPSARKWRLETPSLSTGNHHFYEKNGFVKVREVADGPVTLFVYYWEY
ncbi:MAG: N-acetyltransferase [Chloroflexi bacterium]|nr:MAG: N-acetyltransferase [Chloroflexota bacterium]